MDYTRIYRRQQQAKYTDLKLLISDASQTLEINVHKIILILHSPFFDKLLEFNDENRLKIHVPNAQITRDLILSFYGYPIKYSDWAYILAMTKCQDYFGVEIYQNEIPENITPEDYNYVLEYCSIIGFDKHNCKILVDNLPVIYDIDTLSQDLMIQMIKLCYIYRIASIRDNKHLDMYDIVTGNVVHSISTNSNIETFATTRNGKWFVIMCRDECSIWSNITFEYIYSIRYNTADRNIACLSQHNNTIAFSFGDNCIKIYDLHDMSGSKTINEKSQNVQVLDLMYSHDSSYLASAHDNGLIQLFDMTNYLCVRSTQIETPETVDIKFSVDNTYMLIDIIYKDNIQKEPEMKIWHIASGKILERGKIMDVSFVNYNLLHRYSNKKYIATKKKESVKIYDLDTNTTICKLKHPCTKLLFLPFDYYVVLYEGGLVIDVRTSEIYLSLGNLRNIIYSADGKYLAVENNIDISIWDFHGKNILYKIDYPHQIEMRFSPDNKFFICKYNNLSTMVHSMQNGELLHKIYGTIPRLSINKYYGHNLQRLFTHLDAEKIDEILYESHKIEQNIA